MRVSTASSAPSEIPSKRIFSENPKPFQWGNIIGIIFTVGGVIALFISIYTSGNLPPYFDAIGASILGGVALSFCFIACMDIYGPAKILPFTICSPKAPAKTTAEEEKYSGLA